MFILAKWLGRLATATLWLSGIGLVLMTAFTAYQVWARYVMNDSPSWTEPASVLMMGWFILLGAAVGVRQGYHLGFDILLIVLPVPARKVLMTVSDLAVAAFGAGMSWYGLMLAQGTWASISPAIGIPVGVSYVPLVVGGALIALFSLERMARRFAGLEISDAELPPLDQVA
ncbi:C4-dicarboxylate ABC transporter permease [Aureimonas sp. SA4125]|uniref:TRAP transporter small permease n=1 Tax=Aureimonas sp. SA4125 TaxID=2826993 RepID=UPI001CC76C28|nr:TRAP transporter small permease [Aureimonas sp. SA4125]BDA82899.1 C4-dicarboxylate ABC transporter permease [Aureimonas sp. SA4125]